MDPLHVSLEQNHMATTFELTISTPVDQARHAESVLREAHALVTALEGDLSEFLPGSPVYALNQAPVGEFIELPISVLELLEKSARIEAVTEGSFDVTAKSDPAVAGERGISRRLRWDSGSRRAARLAPGVHLGFGAVGKGYALDRARALIEREGFFDYRLSAGGSSLVFSGFAAPREPWRWGWSWVWSRDGEGGPVPLGIPFTHPSGTAIAIGVSGTHEKGRHLLDPRGGTAEDHAQSALVGCASAADADALSTSLFVAGWTQGLPKFGRMITQPAAALIDAAGVPFWNGLFQKLWGAPTLATLALCLGGFVSHPARADETVDLGGMGLDAFTPYVFDRSLAWIALPVFALALVLIHLKSERPKSKKEKIREI